MKRAWYVNEFEVEGLDGEDPAIHAGGRIYVGVLKHSLNRGRVDFDDEISDADEVNFEGEERAVESVEFEFGLGETRFAVIERYRTEAGIVS